MFTIHWEKDESLKDDLARFSAEALHIEGCSDNLAMNAMMVGLKLGKLLWSIEKKWSWKLLKDL